MLELSARELQIVREILAASIPGLEVRAFGSRVRGAAHAHSDLDLAIVDDQPVALATMGELAEAFEESDLPFRVDLIDWQRTSASFRAVIDTGYEVVQLAG